MPDAINPIILKPCPFCGGQPSVDSAHSFLTTWYKIKCCFVHVEKYAEAPAIAAWNTRTPERPVSDE
jgi:Lar family restriction alleviation protein